VQPAAADPRALAWAILRRVEEGGAFADALLGHRLTGSGLSTRDQGLATRLVYATIAWQGFLDHIANAFSRRPVSELDPPVRTLLRLGLCQMCVLTRIPAFAAVDTSVRLARTLRGGAVAGLLNAVLRRAATDWSNVALPDRATDPLGFLTVRWSHPRWLVERWVVAYGLDEAERLLQANNEAAPSVLRLNRTKGDAAALLARLRGAGVDAMPARFAPCGVQLEQGAGPETLPGFDEGLFCVQGEASQLVGFLVGPASGARVLDACAAPGGKTTHLAELMDDRGEVVALDVHRSGVGRIARLADRLGLSSVRAQVADASVWQPEGWRPGTVGPFDAALVDAPCSGLGTLRQHPEVRWRRTPSDVAALARLQRDLLSHVAAFVRPGGILVYATCTLSREENEDVVAAVLGADTGLVMDDPRPLLPEPARGLVGPDGCLRTLPHRDGLDGFFAARLRRTGAGGKVPV
jgi:16S rRNA (cytosine967-C5)-methyltransferase